jgi:MoaA/NifB/PqqE/SkfB family radical SAM enzyme
MPNVPKVTVNITQNIHNLIKRNPELTWDLVVEGIKECVKRGFMRVVRDVTVTPENGFVYTLEDVVGQVESTSISVDSVEVTIYGTSGPYSGYFNVMVEKDMVKPEMFRLGKYGMKTVLVLH